jgi:dienelactone hydrolase
MAGYNQRYGIIMARHGMAALCYDPIGQGERSQILRENGQPKHRGTTTEHFYIGVGSILVGRNTAGYRVWDGMRCIDYLASRADIDAKRIGFTGCSGGGTLTSYVMALDERVLCAAPSCYLTTFRRLIDTIGPQDAEQNIFAQLAFGMDHPDYVLMRAPRPTLISATTKDFFDISGTWENFRQNKRIYTRLGYPERVNLVEGPGGHGVPMSNLNAIARWMQRWLLEEDEFFAETEIPTRPTEDLLCTEKGQVLLLRGEKSVFDLNTEYEAKLANRRRSFQNAHEPDEVRAKIRELAGIRAKEEIPGPKVRTPGTVQRDGYRIEKLVFERAAGVPLPALRFVPAEPRGETVLYLHGEGKQADAQPGGPIETLVKHGQTVLAVDLSGLGETRRTGSDGPFGDWKNYYTAYLLGKSYVGIRAEETLLAARHAATVEGKLSRPVRLIAVGEAAVPALHAAALEPALFASVTLKEMLPSWREVVAAPETHNQLVNTVHGALEFYDLPDLVRLAGSESVKIEQPVDAMGKRRE